MEVGRCGRWGKTLLMYINIGFLILGVCFTAVGVVMRILGNTFHDVDVMSTLNKIVFNGDLRFGHIFSHISYVTMALGCIVMVFAALSIRCIRRKDRCLLVTYGVIILMVLVAQCVTVGMWCTIQYKVEYKLQSELTTLLKDYEGVTQSTSRGWNILFVGMECCGVDSISSTSNSDEFLGSKWWDSRTHSQDKVPQSCCQEATEDNYQYYNSDTNCQRFLTGHHHKGCYETIKDWIYPYQISAIVIGSFLILIEILAFAYAFVACRTLSIKDVIE